MRQSKIINRFFSFSLFFFFSYPILVFSMEPIPPTLRQVRVSENIGLTIPLGLNFVDPNGMRVSLSQFFNRRRPVIIQFAYYTCPMLCHLVSTGLANGINGLSVSMRDTYDVVTVSLNPNDTVPAAMGFQDKYHQLADVPGISKNWRFLMGDATSIEQLSSALGFRYRYEPKTGQFAHSAVIFILTPDGQISRYLYGISFDPFDLKMALLEAADRKTIKSVDKLLLFCYNYDPQSKKYVIYAMRVMRIGGVLTVLLIVCFIGFFKFKEEK